MRDGFEMRGALERAPPGLSPATEGLRMQTRLSVVARQQGGLGLRRLGELRQQRLGDSPPVLLTGIDGQPLVGDLRCERQLERLDPPPYDPPTHTPLP